MMVRSRRCTRPAGGRSGFSRLLVFVALIVSLGSLTLRPLSAAQGIPAATYSIVARDTATGEIGVAVQSHWFSVGTLVPWAEAGVGAVATQSFVEPAFGAAGLALMRSGRSAPDALRRLLSSDPGVELRQVAMIDSRGRVGVFTGGRSVPNAGHRTGSQFSVQANLVDRPDVWTAMARAYETSRGDLAERMLNALAAAERASGGNSGRRSAAIIVVASRATGRPWDDRIIDLRVEDHVDPIGELRRLIGLSQAYRFLSEGDERLAQGQLSLALQAYERAVSRVSDASTDGEVAFWAGIRLVAAGQESTGLGYLRRAQVVQSHWVEVMRRLPASGILPASPGLIQRLERGMTTGR